MSDLVGDISVSETKVQMQKGLELSRSNTIHKLINLIEKMQVNGLWMMYKQMEVKERKNSSATKELQSSKVQKEVFKV